MLASPASVNILKPQKRNLPLLGKLIQAVCKSAFREDIIMVFAAFAKYFCIAAEKA